MSSRTPINKTAIIGSLKNFAFKFINKPMRYSMYNTGIKFGNSNSYKVLPYVQLYVPHQTLTTVLPIT